eukprot:5284265-Alexandrium_andersonii.AAC.1
MGPVHDRVDDMDRQAPRVVDALVVKPVLGIHALSISPDPVGFGSRMEHHGVRLRALAGKGHPV